MKMVKSLAVIGLACFASMANAAENLTVYSYRQAFLIDPILADFTKKTGIKVDVVFSKKGIAERMMREGRLSKADVVLTS
nr:hypothetical protein [Shewanella halifaxensis]